MTMWLAGFFFGSTIVARNDVVSLMIDSSCGSGENLSQLLTGIEDGCDLENGL